MKPSNILLSSNLDVFISDYGTVRLGENAVKISTEGYNARYSAPEFFLQQLRVNIYLKNIYI